MKVRLTSTAAAVAALLMSQTVVAQQTPAAPEPAASAPAAPAPAATPAVASPAAADAPADAQRIVVTGIRASLQKSLREKRDADTRVEVITSEDIGKMPDKNVADSLMRVPGVNISSASANEGGFDENDRVSLRGTSPSLTQTLVNGHSISSGDWFVLNQTGTVGRSVSYSLLPSQLVDRVVVRKSAEASLVEGGVAGAVDIITRKPLQFGKPLTLEAQAGVVYADLPRKTDPQLSLLGNWKNDENTLGVMLQLFSEKRHLRRDGQELLGYEAIKPDSTIATANPDLAGVLYPVLIGSALFEQERKREGGLLSVQIRPATTLSLTANAFTSKMEASNYNRNYLLWGSRILGGGEGEAPLPGYQVRNGTLVSANFAGLDPTKSFAVYDQISRPDSGSSSKFLSFEADWAATDSLSIKASLGTTRGIGKTPTQDVFELESGRGTGGGWNLNGVDRAADWNLGSNDNSTPGSAVFGWIFGAQNVKVVDKETWGQLDAELEWKAGPMRALKFGARATEHSRKTGEIVAQGPKIPADPPPGTTPDPALDPRLPANWPQGFQQYPGNFGNGLGGDFPRDIWFFTPDQLAAYNRRYANRDPVTRRFWPGEYGLTEKTQAAYAQSDLGGGNWSGNVGVRLVRTQQETLINETAVDPTAPGVNNTSLFGAFVPTLRERTYTDALPSANIKFKLSPELTARFALARVMSRPDYSALTSSVSLSPPPVVAPGAVGTGSGGNPDLKPVRATTFDANVEYYYAPRALLSAGAFHMDLSSYVGFGRVTRQYATEGKDAAGNTVTIPLDYNLTVPVNVKGKVSGIELAWEQPLFSNFGVAANYTYTKAEDNKGDPIVGASKNTINLSAYFENDMFNARVAWNHRSSFYSGLDRQTAFSQEDTSNLAASLGFKFTEQLSLTLDGHNLTNEKLKYFALNRDQPRSIYVNGRQYYLTLRGKF
jgi:iron complex outermembrane recepter protein